MAHLRCFALLLAACLTLVSVSLGADAEYSFAVRNKARQKITQILISEDKQTWSKFEIGEGILPGKSTRLVWNRSGEEQDCKQWVKAVFEDESESNVTRFDLCQGALTIVFEE